MNTKELTPQQSLEVIEQMIQKTNKRVSTYGGIQFLIWGYTTALVSLLVFYLEPSIGAYVHYLWMLIPSVGYLLSWTAAQGRPTGGYSRSEIDRVMYVVWTVMGLNVLVSSFLLGQLSLFVVVLMIASATAITGFVLRIRVLQACSIAGLMLLYLLFALGRYGVFSFEQRHTYLFFALIFFIINCIPGHYLYALAKSELKATSIPKSTYRDEPSN